MKKFKTLLCTLLAATGISASADPFTVTVVVDDASHVRCVDYAKGNAPVELVTGENKFTFDAPYSDYEFYPQEGCALVSVTSQANDYYFGYLTKDYWYASFEKEDVITLTTVNIDDSRTSSFTVTVDDASKISFQRGSDYKVIELENGTNTIKFSPEIDTYFSVSRSFGAADPYKVTQNGKDIPYDYSEYKFVPAEGDVIEVITAYPDIDATITFSYNNGGQGCISDVRIDNVPVTDFDGKTLKVKLGSSLSFSKTNNWNISSWTLNGESSTGFYGYTGIVKGDMDFSFIAEYVDPTVTFNVNIDNAAALQCSYYSYDTYSYVYLQLQDGDNTLKVNRGTSLTFSPVAPYAIKEITNLDNDSPVGIYGSDWNITANNTVSNYKITTYNLDEARTATATVNVDDASKVMFRRQSDYAILELVDGVNTIKFNPETEKVFGVSSKSNTPLWEVKLDGEPASAYYGQYTLNFTDGCTVDITATIPDIDITATFEITDEDAAANLITSVKVEGKEVEFNGTSVAMKAGQSINLTFNNMYKIDSFVCGTKTESYVSGSYNSAALMEDTKFVIAAHKYATIKATVKIDDPTNVTIGNGYGMYNDPTILTLQPGDNEIELPENNTALCWSVNNGCELLSIKHNGVEKLGGYSSYVTIAEGDVVEITSAKIVYDKTAIVWVDDLSAANWQFNLQGDRYNGGTDQTVLNVTAGYNEISFRDAMLPLNLNIQGSSIIGKVYINGEAVEGAYGGNNTFELPVKQDDVVKIFVTNEPVESTLTFDVDEDLEVSATTDRIVPVSDLAEEMTVFNGTEVALTVGNGQKVVVKNGEDVVSPDEDGKYLVTVNGDTALSIKKSAEVGVKEISVEAAADAAIYDLQGRRVNKAGKGLYIINGKKTLLK